MKYVNLSSAMHVTFCDIMRSDGAPDKSRICDASFSGSVTVVLDAVGVFGANETRHHGSQEA